MDRKTALLVDRARPFLPRLRTSAERNSPYCCETPRARRTNTETSRTVIPNWRNDTPVVDEDGSAPRDGSQARKGVAAFAEQ